MANEKRHKRLTINELRTFPGFEKYTDEQAEATIKTLETLSILFYELYMKQKHNERKLTVMKNESDEREQGIAA